jgi:hypothetical protein
MSKIYALLQSISVAVFFGLLLAASSYAQTQNLQTDLNGSFAKYDLIKLDNQTAQRSAETNRTISISASGKTFELSLTPRDLRSARYTAEDASAVGVRQMEKFQVSTFKGKISGEANSEVRMTIDEQKIEGFFETNDGRFFVEPARRYSAFAEADDLIVYRDTDFLKNSGFECDMAEKIQRGTEMIQSNRTSEAQTLRVIEIATDADFQYVQALGSAQAANTEILSILNAAEGVYERELGLTLNVVFQHTWSTQDPFTGIDRPSLLTSFQNYWNANYPAAQVPRDAAHLFTGKSFALGGGYAYIGVICRNPSFAYGLSGYVNFVPGNFLVTTHEIGHNLGANHVDTGDCANTLMNTSLTGSTPMTFCSYSRTEINNYTSANGSCLANQTKTLFDFDGDSKTDLAIFRPQFGEWWYQRSSDQQTKAAQFGTSRDRIVPADYTGDGKTDIALWRPDSGEWFILRSEDGTFYSFPFGTLGDTPAPADYDADGKTDAAVFRASSVTWFINKSTGGTQIMQFGSGGDIPVVADYDADGKADIAIFRPANGQWWRLNSASGAVTAVTFGTRTDNVVPGDYTGDGKADVAIFRPATGEWFIQRSEDGTFYSFPFGALGDTPAPGDFDGDGKFDAAVFRPSNSTWFVQRTTAGTMIQQFGALGDKPVPSAFVP